MAKVDLGGDFAALSTDEFANALALVVAALRGAVVPRNALTGAIEITEGPDAVQPSATLGATDAFWHTLYTRFLNIDGTLVSARTLLPVVPSIFTRPIGDTEDQSAVTTWPWPYDLETSAMVTLVSPQVGGRGGTGGSVSRSNISTRHLLTGYESSGYNDGQVGGYYSFSMFVSSLSRGDEFRFSFGRGGAGGAGGAATTNLTLSGINVSRGRSGGLGAAPVGATAFLPPGDSSAWVVLRSITPPPEIGLDPEDVRFFDRVARYIAPLNVSAGNFLTPELSRNSFSQFYYLGGGESGIFGRSVLFGQGTPGAGESGREGSSGFIIINPIRGTT